VHDDRFAVIGRPFERRGAHRGGRFTRERGGIGRRKGPPPPNEPSKEHLHMSENPATGSTVALAAPPPCAAALARTIAGKGANKRTMGTRNAGDPEDQQKPRRGRTRWTKRWGRLERDDLDALVAKIEGDTEERDARGTAKAWLDAISRVAFAILRGQSVSTESYVAGVLGGDEDPARFACVRVTDGRVVEVFQAFDEGGIDARGPYAITHRERDFSAFGAARAFVDSVGPEIALAALAERTQAAKAAARPRATSVVELVEA
jgi:hypothetical protein